MPTSTASGLLCSAGEWLMPPRLGTKSMAARHMAADHHRIVARSARHTAPSGALGDGCALEHPDERGVELERLERERLLQGRLETLLRGDDRHGLLDELFDFCK